MSTQHYIFFWFLNFAYIWTVKSATFTGSDIICNGNQECYQDIILCDANKDCTITCSGSSSCRYSNILCPINGNCTINCEQSLYTCRQSTINATASTSLHLNCLSSSTLACDNTDVYCPNNGHSGPITCNIYMGSTTASGGLRNIYAVEGFNDVELTGDANAISGSSIRCTETYLTQCSLSNLSPTPYQCNECENILIPTTMPTNTPSIPPSETPSNSPTYIPTFIPTSEPTMEPSSNPTIEPTINTMEPSINPTKIPTISPTPSPTIILRFHDPTMSPTIDQHALDTTLMTGLVTGNNNSKEQNKGVFSKTSNVIILVLCIIIFQLLCIVGMCMFKKYRQRRKATDDPDMIVIQMNSNDKVDNMPRTAIAMQSASAYSVSDKDNIDTGMLMEMNIDEGADENGKNVLMVQETPQYGNDDNKDEMKMDNSLSESENLNVQNNNDFIMEEKDDSADDILHGLTDVGDVIVNTPQDVEQTDSDDEIVIQLSNNKKDNGDDVVMIGITDDGNNEKKKNDNFDIKELEDNDLIDMGGLTDIGDLVVGFDS